MMDPHSAVAFAAVHALDLPALAAGAAARRPLDAHESGDTPADRHAAALVSRAHAWATDADGVPSSSSSSGGCGSGSAAPADYFARSRDSASAATAGTGGQASRPVAVCVLATAHPAKFEEVCLCAPRPVGCVGGDWSFVSL